LNAGLSLHFFPEGTRSPDSFVQRFHRGAFELAVALKQEILPVVLCDTNCAMPRDAYWFEPFNATVRALPRVTPQNFDYSQGVVPLMKHCEAIVREGLQQQLDEINTPRVVRRKINRFYRYQGKFVEEFVRWKMSLIRFSCWTRWCRARASCWIWAAVTASRRTGWHVSRMNGRFSALITTRTRSAWQNVLRRNTRASDSSPATFWNATIRRAM
jgi:hypothetical protein